jgi:peptidoglycan/LPS O-acetylase OafA/YrhL
MSKCSPYIPWEASKYILLLISLIFVFKLKNKRNILSIFLILLLLPAVIFSIFNNFNFDHFVFNFLGSFVLSLLIYNFQGLKIGKEDFIIILRILWLNCVSVISFITIKTPELSDVEYKLAANFETSGGFGSNQISTIMGIGLFLSGYAWFKNLKFSGIRLLDGFILIAFAVRGLLTFSRGGMFVAVMALVIFFIFEILGKSPNKIRNIFFLFTIVIIGIIGFNYVDDITGGNLALRYQGKTQGTIVDNQEVTLNKFTTGRYDIL